MSVTAGTIINSVRDLIPDPVYDSNGNPLPAQDGSLFRSQSLYRWLDNGVKLLAGQTAWCVNDWYAYAVTANIPWYDLDGKWISCEMAFQNGLQLWLSPEQYTIWPKTVTGDQAITYSLHNLTDHLQIRYFPAPSTTDPSTTINQVGGISSTATTVTVTDTTNFMQDAYVLIDSEIIKYGATTTTTLAPLLRGQCGTTAATHANGATVQMLSAWIQGNRVPTEITASTSVVELPLAFQPALEDFLLWKCWTSQNDVAAAKEYRDSFRAECRRIMADPGWRSDTQGTSILPYGVPTRGGLYYSQGPFGVIVP